MQSFAKDSQQICNTVTAERKRERVVTTWKMITPYRVVLGKWHSDNDFI